MAQMTRTKFLLLSFVVAAFVSVLALASYHLLANRPAMAPVGSAKPSQAQQAAINRHIDDAFKRSLAAIALTELSVNR
jgi:hypothetical protein